MSKADIQKVVDYINEAALMFHSLRDYPPLTANQVYRTGYELAHYPYGKSERGFKKWLKQQVIL